MTKLSRRTALILVFVCSFTALAANNGRCGWIKDKDSYFVINHSAVTHDIMIVNGRKTQRTLMAETKVINEDVIHKGKHAVEFSFDYKMTTETEGSDALEIQHISGTAYWGHEDGKYYASTVRGEGQSDEWFFIDTEPVDGKEFTTGDGVTNRWEAVTNYTIPAMGSNPPEILKTGFIRKITLGSHGPARGFSVYKPGFGRVYTELTYWGSNATYRSWSSPTE